MDWDKRWRIRRSFALVIIGAALVVCAGGPLYGWWRTRSQVAALKPIVEKCRLRGVELKMTGRSEIVLTGFGLTTLQEEQLRRDVAELFRDGDKVDRVMRNVYTQEELDKLRN
ncbi:MAG: hypothetical protein L0Y44_13755 [Phycisphaerales bacterium]|nr:hypothetical protein [Phycisphaerales bacterium]MCI0631710.1 hypothetical protein [Phycisphaerales bacterium]MCI0676428.1 hypothetical protein [Phycisphaerales bacterium]